MASAEGAKASEAMNEQAIRERVMQAIDDIATGKETIHLAMTMLYCDGMREGLRQAAEVLDRTSVKEPAPCQT